MINDIFHKAIDEQERLYDALGLSIHSMIREQEGTDYYAHAYSINQNRIKFRIAKKTPKKIGYFVTLWKRNAHGITAPHDQSDPVDFFIIFIHDNDKIGLFIFPKSTLTEKNIVSCNGNGGKRGIRVYPSWCTTDSKQAIKTQEWQKAFFIDLHADFANNMAIIDKILAS